MLFRSTASLLLFLCPATSLLRGQNEEITKRQLAIDCNTLDLNKLNIAELSPQEQIDVLNCLQETSTNNVPQPGYDANGVYTCVETGWWDSEPVKDPVVPCTTHAECAGWSDKQLADGFEPCCMSRSCICGSTQSMFMAGTGMCAELACSSDADCGAGRCNTMKGACDFSNIQPLCSTANPCGSGETCIFGACWEIEESGKGRFTGGGSGGSDGGDSNGMGMMSRRI